MNSELDLLLWGFVGTLVLSILFKITMHPWQIGGRTPKYSIFSLSFWFQKNFIYDIPREEQDSHKPVERWTYYPRLLILNTGAFLLCALTYQYLSTFGYWTHIFIIWAVLFFMFPIVGPWWMYWFDPHKKDRILRKAYTFWCWIILITVLIAYITQTQIFNIDVLINKIVVLLPLNTPVLGKAALIITIIFAWRRSHVDTKFFEVSIKEQGKKLGINIDYGNWSSHTHHIYDFGLIYSVLIVVFEVNL